MLPAKHRVIHDKTQLYYQHKDGTYPIEVRKAKGDIDFDSIVRINRLAFPHDNENDDFARRWIKQKWESPYFVIAYNELNVVGYILWSVKGGYKSRLSFELEQVAIDASYHGQGFGSLLIELSLIKFQQFLQTQFQCSAMKLGIVHLTTGCSNYVAQAFYRKILQVEQKGGKIAAIYGSNEYGEEEIIMINERIESVVERFADKYKDFS